MGIGLLRRKSVLRKVGGGGWVGREREREVRSQEPWSHRIVKYILRRAPQPQSGELIIKKALGIRSRGNQQVRDDSGVD